MSLLLCHIANSVGTSTEDIATMSLHYILQSSTVARDTLFIITHNTSITENTYGYSYRCKDSDAGEKVCEISNNDDSIEELYFKRVGFRWLLMKIEQKTL